MGFDLSMCNDAMENSGDETQFGRRKLADRLRKGEDFNLCWLRVIASSSELPLVH